MSFNLISEFYAEMQYINFNAFGILDASDNIHTLGTDSKIIGRVFEMFTQPILEKIATNHNLQLKTPDSQTVYPDFVLMSDEQSRDKIAIDIKTTYIDDNHSSIKFTLGSFASYMRNNTKNIEYQYTDYTKHYVIGFVYKRNDYAQASKQYAYSHRHQIIFPYSDVQYFIQEKYKIAGDKPGSGNTENIGSFSSTDILDFKNGLGPFSQLGQDIFDIYWKYYPQYRSPNKPYTSLNEFITWLPQHIDEIELFHDFDKENVRNKLRHYQQSTQNHNNQ